VHEDSAAAVSQDTSSATLDGGGQGAAAASEGEDEEDVSKSSSTASQMFTKPQTDFTPLFARLGILSSASDTPSLVMVAQQQQQHLLPIRHISTTTAVIPTPTIRGTAHWPSPLPLPPPGEEANACRLAVLLRGGAPPPSPPLPLHNSILPNTASGRPRPLATHTTNA
jgi:hypothetical protein